MPSSRTVRQTSSRYVNRDSPPFKASAYCGEVMRGNDGHLWLSVENSAGTFCQWREYHGAETDDEREERKIEKLERRESRKKASAKRAASTKRASSAKKAPASRTSSTKRGASSGKARGGGGASGKKRTSAGKSVRAEYVRVPVARNEVLDAKGRALRRRSYEDGDRFLANGFLYVRDGARWVAQ